VEKYRPEKVEDVAHQEEVVKTLKTSILQGNLPHLLFHGPPGTGKTTTILAVARELFGPELYKQRILELNASDERGISVIREKVKNFAQGAVGGQKTPGYPCPRFKIIVLDEADTMTPDAQSALRRVIELHSKVTRFCLICNYVTRVIEPLASRCAKFRFKNLPVDSMIARLEHIAGTVRLPSTLSLAFYLCLDACASLWRVACLGSDGARGAGGRVAQRSDGGVRRRHAESRDVLAVGAPAQRGHAGERADGDGHQRAGAVERDGKHLGGDAWPVVRCLVRRREQRRGRGVPDVCHAAATA